MDIKFRVGKFAVCTGLVSSHVAFQERTDKKGLGVATFQMKSGFCMNQIGRQEREFVEVIAYDDKFKPLACLVKETVRRGDYVLVLGAMKETKDKRKDVVVMGFFSKLDFTPVIERFKDVETAE